MPLEIRGAHFFIRSAQLVRKTRLEQALRGPTHTHPFNGPFSRTTRVSRYQKGETNLDFTEARDSDWTWHQLSHMQVCTSLQTDNHASTPPLSFVTGRMPFLPPNRVMYQDCYQTVYRYFTKSSPLPTYFTVPDQSISTGIRGSKVDQAVANVCRGPKNYSYTTAQRRLTVAHVLYKSGTLSPSIHGTTFKLICTQSQTTIPSTSTSLAVMLIQQLAVDLISNSQTTVYSGIHERSEFIPLQTVV